MTGRLKVFLYLLLASIVLTTQIVGASDGIQIVSVTSGRNPIQHHLDNKSNPVNGITTDSKINAGERHIETDALQVTSESSSEHEVETFLKNERRQNERESEGSNTNSYEISTPSSDDVAQATRVPSVKDQVETFLNNERQQIERESMDFKSSVPNVDTDQESNEYVQKVFEYLDSGTLRNQILRQSSSLKEAPTATEDENEDVWVVEMSPDAKITQYFLSNERKSSEDGHREPILGSSTTNMYAIQTNDVQVMEREAELHSDLLDEFLNEEKQRSEVDNSPVQNVEFVIKTEHEVSTPNVGICGTVNLNKLVDEVIGDLRIDIVENGLDKIKIPDIHESFKKEVGFISVTGDFKAEKGWAKNISTIQRTADVTASAEGNSITISCGFGLSDLEFGYDKYTATFINLGPTGKIHAVIVQNSLLLNATITWNNHTCTTKLNYLSLNQFGGLTLKITGLGPLNFLVTNISDWAFQRFKMQIKKKVETTIKGILEKQLKTFDCAKYIYKLALLSYK